jgi:branched-chain amino acid transport system substrate-binding protein
MRQSNPEAVFVLATAPVASLVLKSARRLGWQAPLFANIAARDALAVAAGEAAEGVIISQVVPPPDRTDLPLIALYNRLLKERGKEKDANYLGSKDS